MLLVIDAGNTQMMVGLYDPAPVEEPQTASSGLLGHWRMATSPDRTEDEIGLAIAGFTAEIGIELENDVTGLAISSGVPSVTASLRRFAERYLDVSPVVLGPGVKSGMPIRYEDPRSVGADRIANAVAALELYGASSVVVDFGTATTFDVIDSTGAYLGGAILPGLEISLEALFGRAALLREVDLTEPKGVIGRNTHESIQSGVIFGSACLVDGMIDRIEEEIGDVTVIATGGYAELIAPHARTVDHHEPWLTLHGLRLVHNKNVL
ncbi:MAG: type III pantothenate kinase [Actinomycetota bacterium]|jgi:type III pantothenate kinase|nr:type III pantothenate kinase [Acidimicrobiales bacterium]